MEKYINRYYDSQWDNLLKKGKVLVITGARQVGKTTLVNTYLDQSKHQKIYRSTGEDAALRTLFDEPVISQIKANYSGYNLLFIDEAQDLPKAGKSLKLLVDHLPDTYIVATGSSSLELSNKLGEPLTGRKKNIQLFPLALLELESEYGWAEVNSNLEDYLRFGTYPEVLTTRTIEDKIKYLEDLIEGYLFKDLLKFEKLKNANKLKDLLRLVAHRVGHEVSHQELGKQLSMSKNTVERYLDLLEQVFVIVRVRGFSRKLRKEVTKFSKYYFFDNGLRNALIQDFKPLKLRNDKGQLWENFLFIERLKKRIYQRIRGNYYFWRTYDQQEIDLIEDKMGKLSAFEFKMSPPSRIKAPAAWGKAYPESEFNIISRNDLHKFVL